MIEWEAAIIIKLWFCFSVGRHIHDPLIFDSGKHWNFSCRKQWLCLWRPLKSPLFDKTLRLCTVVVTHHLLMTFLLFIFIFLLFCLSLLLCYFLMKVKMLRWLDYIWWWRQWSSYPFLHFAILFLYSLDKINYFFSPYL